MIKRINNKQIVRNLSTELFVCRRDEMMCSLPIRMMSTLFPQAGTSLWISSPMRRGDLLVAIGSRQRSKLFKFVMKHAQERGLKVILIADLSATESRKYADLVLRCHCKEFICTIPRRRWSA